MNWVVNAAQDALPPMQADRLAASREFIMSEIALNERTAGEIHHHWTRGRRRAGLAVAALVAAGGAAVGVGVPVSADSLAIWRNDRGDVGIDAGALRPVYQGRELSSSTLRNLQSRGAAQVAVVNRELSCQGITLYFDNQQDADTYFEQAAARQATIAPAATGDPCAPFVGGPRFITTK